jgi:hypothetical protein
VLFGFYENTFATMRACYDELGRSPDAPISEFCAADPEDEARHPERYAMKRNHMLFLAQPFDGKTHVLDIAFPPNRMVPGDGASTPIWTSIRQAWNWLWWFERKRHEIDPPPPILRGHLYGWLDDVRDVLQRVGIDLLRLKRETEFLPRAAGSLSAAGTLIEKLQGGMSARVDDDRRSAYGVVGDWVRTGLNCGCMEATVMSGMQAARALGRYHGQVSGEVDVEYADVKMEVIGMR